MGKIVDLDKLLNRTISFKIKGEVINVKEITVNQFERMVAIENIDGKKGQEAQLEFIAEVLSSNEEGKKFDVKGLKDLQRSVITLIWATLVARSVDTSYDPN